MIERMFKEVCSEALAIILLVWWLCGFVVAKGFWSTAFCIFPPYAFYLVIDALNKLHNFLG